MNSSHPDFNPKFCPFYEELSRKIAKFCCPSSCPVFSIIYVRPVGPQVHVPSLNSSIEGRLPVVSHLPLSPPQPVEFLSPVTFYRWSFRERSSVLLNFALAESIRGRWWPRTANRWTYLWRQPPPRFAVASNWTATIPSTCACLLVKMEGTHPAGTLVKAKHVAL